MKETLNSALKEIAIELGLPEASFSVEHPKELSHGDYATNIALVAAKAAGKNPQEVAEEIVKKLQEKKLSEIETVSVAGPGFINISLSNSFFTDAIKTILEEKDFGTNKTEKGKKILIEYTQPNPFKPFHIGHLMSNTIGESLTRIFEYASAEVIRANYQGDIGLHVAKAIWGLQKNTIPEAIQQGTAAEQAAYIGAAYVEGAKVYEEDTDAKNEIDAINKKVYDKSDKNINELYDWGRKVTLEAFELLYLELGTKFDYYFFESQMAPLGAAIVKENVGTVFTESEGAIVFEAEKRNPKLHTRVFITRNGLPTYEAKELGLQKTKFETINPDFSITTTAVEQADYMKVIKEAVMAINPSWGERMQHVTHGMMRFASGKMSSRTGNVITGESLLKDAVAAVTEKMKDRIMEEHEKIAITKQVAIAAIKYSVLRQALGSDIVFDFEKSISFEGDSGPYLQYSVTRAKSVIAKAESSGMKESMEGRWEVSELEKRLYRFPEVVLRAKEELEPHHIVTYLTELSSAFNGFYAEHQIVGDAPEHAYRLSITKAFAKVLEKGLWLLGITIPERM